MVKENLASCAKRIAARATLVAVTKGVPLPLIYEAIDSGVTNIAENRIQEALMKYGPVCAYARNSGVSLKWHMVGHLQTNKVKDAVGMFDLIHSVDSIKVAFEINKEAGKAGKLQDVLIEVKTSAEATKYGFAPSEVREVVKEISAFKNINMKGLMTVAPIVDDAQKARPYFRQLRELRDEIGHGLEVLSMGMTDDFEAAIQEGANMVRIGRGIFKD